MASLARRLFAGETERASFALPFQQWVDMFKFQNVMYPVGYAQTLLGDREDVKGDYLGLSRGAYQSNGVVFACLYTRMLHFKQARFQFRQIRNSGRPGNLFGTQALRILEEPWPGGTTGDLLARMIQDVDLSGNAYIVREGDRLGRLRPDWVSILLGSSRNRRDFMPGDPDTVVAGYVYKPGGPASQEPERVYDASRVAHWAPITDPLAFKRGMSLLTAVIQEIQSDLAMSSHRQRFFEHGATTNLVIKSQPQVTTQEQFQEWVQTIREGHEGLAKAYRTLYLAAGTEVQPIGQDLQQADFKVVQGAGEVRIATACRVPATLLGISEGLQGSTLNAGNFQQARRNFADGLLRPYWEGAASALSNIIQVPSDAQLYYDDRDIAFLKEDLKDVAEVQQMQAAAIKSLIDAGFEPAAIIDAVTSDDFTRLRTSHTGLTSVQLQPPATAGTALNGNGNPTAIPQLTG